MAETMRRGKARSTYIYRGYFIRRVPVTNVGVRGGSDTYWTAH